MSSKSYSEKILYLIEDDDSFRQSLMMALDFESYKIIEFSNAEDFLAQEVLYSGVVLTDMILPSKPGIDIQSELLSRGLNLPIIFMSGQSSLSQAIEAMKMGAINFFIKPFNPALLIEAIAVAFEKLAGDTVLASSRQEVEKKLAALSPREKEVYELLIKGYGNADLSRLLGITVPTAKEYKGNVYRKLGLNSFPELLKMAEK